MRVLVADTFESSGIDGLKAAGCDVLYQPDLKDAALWTYDEAAFLPHGSARDGNPAMQPIWLTHRDENPNGASMIVLVDGLEAEDLQAFTRCADVFDGNDADAVVAARGRWRRARDAGHNLNYWQQTALGWERKT